MTRSILFIVLLILFSAFFSGSEISYAGASEVKLRKAAENAAKKRSREKYANHIKENYEEALISILIGNNLVNIASSAVATVIAIGLMGDAGAGVATLVMTVIIIIFGEITPKIVAARKPESFAFAAAVPLHWFAVVTKPLVWVFSAFMKAVGNLWEKSAVDDAVTEDDLEAARAANPWFLFRDILPGYQYFGRDENNVPTGLLEGPSTVSQFLNILGLFDDSRVSEGIVSASIAYAKKGYTAILDSGAPDYFVRGFMSTATDLLQSGLALQRNIVTAYVPKETDPYLALQRMAQRETLCVECADLLSASSVRFFITCIQYKRPMPPRVETTHRSMPSRALPMNIATSPTTYSMTISRLSAVRMKLLFIIQTSVTL